MLTDSIFAFLSPAGAGIFKQVAKATVGPVEHYFRSQFQLEPVLHRFFSDDETIQFGKCLRNFEMFILGLIPVQVLRRERYSGSDL